MYRLPVVVSPPTESAVLEAFVNVQSDVVHVAFEEFVKVPALFQYRPFANPAVVVPVPPLATVTVPRDIAPPPVPRATKPEHERGEEQVSDDVAALATVPAAVAYKTCGAVILVEVERPAQEIAGVAPPVENIGAVAVTEVTVPCGCAVQPTTPDALVVRAEVPLHEVRLDTVRFVVDAVVVNKVAQGLLTIPRVAVPNIPFCTNAVAFQITVPKLTAESFKTTAPVPITFPVYTFVALMFVVEAFTS